MRSGRGLFARLDEPDLDEVARPGLEMLRHSVQMPPELRRAQMKQRVDGTHRAVEGPPEIELRHVCFDHVASRPEPSARELDHPRRAVDADNLTAAIRERLEHPSRAAPGSKTVVACNLSTSQSASSEMSQSNAMS